MAYRKFSADKIFSGDEFLPDDTVLITSEDGTVEAFINTSEAGEDVLHVNGILSPGFVNCHCHLELSHMKGLIPEKTGLIDFVWSIVTLRNFDGDIIRQAIADAEAAMIKNGIVAVGDICNNAITLEQKQQQQLLYYNFVEVSGFIPSNAQQRVNAVLTVYNSFKNLHTEHTTMVPHAPYSVSDRLIEMMQPYYRDKVVSIHNQETIHEEDFFRYGTGDFRRLYEKMQLDISFHQPVKTSSLQWYYKQLEQAASRILVHNTFTSTEDILYMQQHPNLHNSTFLCLCVNANLYIENALPPIPDFIEKNCNIILGTDSLASNHSLSILEEIKTIRKHFPSIEDATLLNWATLNGAKALMMDVTIGSFQKNKKPGIICITPGFESVSRIL